jgi:hypothetical protein
LGASYRLAEANITNVGVAEPRWRSTQAIPPPTIVAYEMLHTMFHDAVVDELIATNPACSIVASYQRRSTPIRIGDRSAVFAREEVEALISDERIPEDRRVVGDGDELAAALATVLGGGLDGTT